MSYKDNQFNSTGVYPPVSTGVAIGGTLVSIPEERLLVAAGLGIKGAKGVSSRGRVKAKFVGEPLEFAEKFGAIWGKFFFWGKSGEKAFGGGTPKGGETRGTGLWAHVTDVSAKRCFPKHKGGGTKCFSGGRYLYGESTTGITVFFFSFFSLLLSAPLPRAVP